MCINIFSYYNHPVYKLILAGNRDEFYSRPTSQANYWDKHPELLAGHDLASGGTWMGITLDGKIAFVSNFRDIASFKKEANSRGLLVVDYLIGDDSPKGYVSKIKNPDEYNGFNLIVSDLKQMVYASNKMNEPTVLLPGNYCLSNTFLDSNWPKVKKGKKLFEDVISNRNFNVEDLFQILLDDEKFSDDQLPDTGLGIEREREASSIFIKTEDYGTVSSTVILVDKENNVTFSEKNYLPRNVDPLIKTFNFKIKVRDKV